VRASWRRNVGSGTSSTHRIKSIRASAVSPRVTDAGGVMRLSARNQIKGKILEVKKGATTSHIRVEIAPGQILTSSITNEAVEELNLKAGGNAIVVIKASDVMIGIE
jgi:molybdopterin-binding protein